MAVLPIRITGDPVLHSAAQPVTEFDVSLRQLVDDMFDTMTEARVGLRHPGGWATVFVTTGPMTSRCRRGVAINRAVAESDTCGRSRRDDESEGCPVGARRAVPLRRAELATLTR